MTLRTREQIIDPGSGAQDSKNYLENGNRELSPGVRHESAPVIDEGPYITLSPTITAGVMLKNIDGQVRMTLWLPGIPTKSFIRQLMAARSPKVGYLRISHQ